MLFRYALAVGLAAAVVTPAAAQAVACRVNDPDCLSTEAVLRVVDRFGRQGGLAEYVIGTACANGALTAKGRTEYLRTLPGLVAAAETASTTALGSTPLAQAQPIQARVPSLVRTARNSQASGMAAGMESIFTMYPRSKAEYCKLMAEKLGG